MGKSREITDSIRPLVLSVKIPLHLRVKNHNWQLPAFPITNLTLYAVAW